MVAEGKQIVQQLLYMQNSVFMLTVYSLAYFYHCKSPQGLPHLLDNVNKTWGHFLALPCWQFVCLITFERPLPLCFAINRKWLLLNSSKETAISSVLFVTIYWSKKELTCFDLVTVFLGGSMSSSSVSFCFSWDFSSLALARFFNTLKRLFDAKRPLWRPELAQTEFSSFSPA